jgi:peptidylprolyl isomerase
MSEDVIVGSGAEAQATSAITAHYVLMGWTSGQVLETSWSAQPFTTTLDQVIPGWQQGIPGMKVGGRRLLVIPPTLGYGEQPIGGVANETLVFVVDLIAVS